MDQEITARLGLGGGCAAKLNVIAGSQRDLCRNLFLGVLDKRTDITASDVEGDGLNAARAIVQYDISPGCLIDTSQLPEGP